MPWLREQAAADVGSAAAHHKLKMRRNNFDCIRLFAALMVMISHSFALSGVAYDPIFQGLGGYSSGGDIGVAIFFVISGFLVAGSVSRHSTSDYLASRALRIIPALIFISFFDVFVIGPAFTTHPLPSYFSDGATWSHLFNAKVFGMNMSLPGVFDTLPIASVNGSLWTLPIECGLYLILPALAFCGGLTRGGSILAFAGCFVAYLVATGFFGLYWRNQGPEVISGVALFSALRYTTFFFAGAALWANRDAIRIHAGGAIICVFILYAVARTATAPVAYFLCLPYLVLFAALKTPFISLEKIGDLSYGTYVFAFPIQQASVSILGTGHPVRVFALAVPITLTLAFLSWRFVEEPALRFRTHRAVVSTDRPLLSPAET